MGSEGWQLRCAELKQRGAYLYKSKLWSDCTFQLDEVTVKAHKLIMAMASPVFSKMLYGSFVKFPMAIDDVRPEVFDLLLEYIYSDNLNITSSKDACDLYYAAKKWRMPHVAKQCMLYLNEHMSPENVLHIYKVACESGDDTLQNTCEKIFTTKTKEILKDTSFYDTELTVVTKLFSLEPLNIDNELDLFEAAVKYANIQDTKTRKKNISLAEDEVSTPVKKTRRLADTSQNDQILTEDCSEMDLDESSHEATESLYATANSVEEVYRDKKENQKYRDLIKPIRFLTLSSQEFAECQCLSALLSTSEMLALSMNVASRETILPMPQGFSTCMVPRTQVTKEDRTRLAAVFRSVIQNFSNIKKYESTPYYLRNLPWTLMVLLSNENSLILAVTCFFDAGPPEWLKNAKLKVKFCTHKPVPKNLHKISLKVSAPTSEYGAWVAPVKRSDLLNPDYGFVDEFNTATYKLYINTVARPNDSPSHEETASDSVSTSELHNLVLRVSRTPTPQPAPSESLARNEGIVNTPSTSRVNPQSNTANSTSRPTSIANPSLKHLQSTPTVITSAVPKPESRPSPAATNPPSQTTEPSLTGFNVSASDTLSGLSNPVSVPFIRAKPLSELIATSTQPRSEHDVTTVTQSLPSTPLTCPLSTKPSECVTRPISMEIQSRPASNVVTPGTQSRPSIPLTSQTGSPSVTSPANTPPSATITTMFAQSSPSTPVTSLTKTRLSHSVTPPSITSTTPTTSSALDAPLQLPTPVIASFRTKTSPSVTNSTVQLELLSAATTPKDSRPLAPVTHSVTSGNRGLSSTATSPAVHPQPLSPVTFPSQKSSTPVIVSSHRPSTSLAVPSQRPSPLVTAPSQRASTSATVLPQRSPNPVTAPSQRASTAATVLSPRPSNPVTAPSQKVSTTATVLSPRSPNPVTAPSPRALTPATVLSPRPSNPVTASSQKASTPATVLSPRPPNPVTVLSQRPSTPATVLPPRPPHPIPSPPWMPSNPVTDPLRTQPLSVSNTQPIPAVTNASQTRYSFSNLISLPTHARSSTHFTGPQTQTRPLPSSVTAQTSSSIQSVASHRIVKYAAIGDKEKRRLLSDPRYSTFGRLNLYSVHQGVRGCIRKPHCNTLLCQFNLTLGQRDILLARLKVSSIHDVNARFFRGSFLAITRLFHPQSSTSCVVTQNPRPLVSARPAASQYSGASSSGLLSGMTTASTQSGLSANASVSRLPALSTTETCLTSTRLDPPTKPPASAAIPANLQSPRQISMVNTPPPIVPILTTPSPSIIVPTTQLLSAVYTSIPTGKHHFKKSEFSSLKNSCLTLSPQRPSAEETTFDASSTSMSSNLTNSPHSSTNKEMSDLLRDTITFSRPSPPVTIASPTNIPLHAVTLPWPTKRTLTTTNTTISLDMHATTSATLPVSKSADLLVKDVPTSNYVDVESRTISQSLSLVQKALSAVVLKDKLTAESLESTKKTDINKNNLTDNFEDKLKFKKNVPENIQPKSLQAIVLSKLDPILETSNVRRANIFKNDLAVAQPKQLTELAFSKVRKEISAEKDNSDTLENQISNDFATPAEITDLPKKDVENAPKPLPDLANDSKQTLLEKQMSLKSNDELDTSNSVYFQAVSEPSTLMELCLTLVVRLLNTLPKVTTENIAKFDSTFS